MSFGDPRAPDQEHIARLWRALAEAAGTAVLAHRISVHGDADIVWRLVAHAHAVVTHTQCPDDARAEVLADPFAMIAIGAYAARVAGCVWPTCGPDPLCMRMASIMRRAPYARERDLRAAIDHLATAHAWRISDHDAEMHRAATRIMRRLRGAAREEYRALAVTHDGRRRIGLWALAVTGALPCPAIPAPCRGYTEATAELWRWPQPPAPWGRWRYGVVISCRCRPMLRP